MIKKYNKIIKPIFLILCCGFLFSCQNKQNINNLENTGDEISIETNDDGESVVETFDSGCKFEDGSYSATVDYNNSETGYSATYTLDVEVSECQIVQINFPNDGYLDDDHITYTDIEDDGTASVDGEDGKTYQIQIDN